MTNPFRLVTLAARRVLCAAFGHDRLLQIEPYRLSLRCVICGHETTGWTIGQPEPGTPNIAGTRRPSIEARHAA